ncbi:GcrA family cell cycle regulator, partial [Rhodopila globiformis]
MVWNEETIRHLRVLWAEGHSTAEIGRRLGVSKNAIVGKAHRLDLDARPSPIKRDAAKPVVERPGACAKGAGPTLPPLASSVDQLSAAPPALEADAAPPAVAEPVSVPAPMVPKLHVVPPPAPPPAPPLVAAVPPA